MPRINKVKMVSEIEKYISMVFQLLFSMSCKIKVIFASSAGVIMSSL